MKPNDIPHQSALRKGRFSESEKWYSITSCINGNKPLLVRDRFQPSADMRAAQIVIDAMQWLHERKRWTCKAYVVMPDHIHIVVALGADQTLSSVMSSFGKYTARKLNDFLGSKGRIWQHGFYDHCLRNDESYIKHLRYICENPLRKGWAEKVEDWPFLAIEPDW
ncbi:MAG: transposase [Proteobacteria bacterium]|nr:transposase [Pseudomonadota bacterium]